MDKTAALARLGLTGDEDAAGVTRAYGQRLSSMQERLVSAQTDAERRGAIEGAMDESLGDFDEAIRKERERIARERNERVARNGTAGGTGEGTSGSGSGADTGGGDGSGSRDGDLQQGSAGSGNSDGQGGEKGQGDLKSGGGGGGVGGGKSGSGPSTAPANVPDGRDDDVIARQIREAAEKETDPELRDKLWKEYIEYKKNVQK